MPRVYLCLLLICIDALFDYFDAKIRFLLPVREAMDWYRGMASSGFKGR